MRRGTPGLGDVHAEALRAGASDSSRDSEEARVARAEGVKERKTHSSVGLGGHGGSTFIVEEMGAISGR